MLRTTTTEPTQHEAVDLPVVDVNGCVIWIYEGVGNFGTEESLPSDVSRMVGDEFTLHASEIPARIILVEGK